LKKFREIRSLYDRFESWPSDWVDRGSWCGGEDRWLRRQVLAA